MHLSPSRGRPASEVPPAPSDVSIRDTGCTCFHVRRLARRVTQFYDRMLAPCGLRTTQFSLLTCLVREPMAMQPLADLLDMDRTTLTRNLRPLLDARLVRIEPAAHDARVRRVCLTPDGRARRVEARRLWQLAQTDVNRAWGASRVASLHHLFDELIETFNDKEAA